MRKFKRLIAQMAELVDAQVSDTCIERCGGSSPLLGTNTTYMYLQPICIVQLSYSGAMSFCEPKTPYSCRSLITLRTNPRLILTAPAE